MQAQAYEGYFENGNFYTAGQKVRIPERKRVFITVLDETPKNIEERLKEFDALVEAIHGAADEKMPEIERIKFREVEL